MITTAPVGNASDSQYMRKTQAGILGNGISNWRPRGAEHSPDVGGD